MLLTAFPAAVVTVALYMCCVFLLALLLKDNSIVDIAYGGAFLMAVIAASAVAWKGHPRQVLMAGMIAVWGLRLMGHLYLRSRGRGEDFRYRKWR